MKLTWIDRISALSLMVFATAMTSFALAPSPAQ